MISDEFSERMIAHMAMALERACGHSREKLADHESRRFVAARIVECVRDGTPTLAGMTEAARRAIDELCAINDDEVTKAS
ncbi:MAG: hypothetical protein JWP25_971 [Bradyrhizobium sp.]|jgi:hypothetical protein|nr:hypothetical protein [Bradyrhizobium sp.]